MQTEKINNPKSLDVDECAHVDLTTDGSFMCVCEEGYYSFGKECLDVNECYVYKLHQCPDNSSCVNTDGSYTCICRDGFVMAIDTGDTKKCFNINECLDNNSCDIASGAICEDTNGGYKCSCPSNMQGSGYIGEPNGPCRKEVVCMSIVNCA